MALALEPLLRCVEELQDPGADVVAPAARQARQRRAVGAAVDLSAARGAGAAKCWAAQHVIPLGCDYVATAILDDPCIGLAERELGINEHVHTVWAYLAAFVRAGLRIRRVQPGINELRYRVASVLARVPKAGMSLAAVGELSVGPYAGVTIFARKPYE